MRHRPRRPAGVAEAAAVVHLKERFDGGGPPARWPLACTVLFSRQRVLASMTDRRWRTRAVRAQPEQPVLSRYGQVTGRHRVAFQTGVGRIGSRSRNHRLDSNLQMSHRGVVCRESGVPLSSACAWQTAGARRRIRPLAVGHVAS